MKHDRAFGIGMNLLVRTPLCITERLSQHHCQDLESANHGSVIQICQSWSNGSLWSTLAIDKYQDMYEGAAGGESRSYFILKFWLNHHDHISYLFFTKIIPKGPFRIYDWGGGGFDPNGRSKTSTPP